MNGKLIVRNGLAAALLCFIGSCGQIFDKPEPASDSQPASLQLSFEDVKPAEARLLLRLPKDYGFGENSPHIKISIAGVSTLNSDALDLTMKSIENVNEVSELSDLETEGNHLALFGFDRRDFEGINAMQKTVAELKNVGKKGLLVVQIEPNICALRETTKSVILSGWLKAASGQQYENFVMDADIDQYAGEEYRKSICNVE